ncbi:endonuclease/exonuclease/phosphatase family protein [Rhodocytophaga aerolata]|uniref:Endonuclease/exonuclease/phosphatase family protein n=1 Tax=Rhodocytophaga aerolata TaxID=455078 RepID=A0ABT8REX0_9BACT|nr:endonuclease/exonuclease/phosphatase family protein [Rhodocytophaga aerolata]MDO1450661.1 endonuclease/exonuclease/phosphatase family protein [Rhodocytophaga aerolata]
MRIFTYCLSVFCIFATGLPLIHSGYWWIRIFDYPRAQIAIVCLITLTLYYFYVGIRKKWQSLWFVLLLVALAYQLLLISKYTPLFPVQAKKGKGASEQQIFTIMEANIRMQNEQTGKFLQLVYAYKPDILVINEPNAWWAEELAPLNKMYAYSLKKPLENTYGMMLYSNLPLKDTEINFLVEKGIPSMYARVLLPTGEDFDLHCLHPKPPKPGSPTYERDTEILLVGKRIKQSDRPAIVVGDLNDVAWSYTSELFQRYSGLVDPREGRGLYNTYSVFVPLFRYPLDHFFYSAHFGLLTLHRLESIGSDHFPMLISLSYEPTQDHAKDLPEVDMEDKKSVEKKIKKGM